jgi:hypothetical protein
MKNNDPLFIDVNVTLLLRAIEMSKMKKEEDVINLALEQYIVNNDPAMKKESGWTEEHDIKYQQIKDGLVGLSTVECGINTSVVNNIFWLIGANHKRKKEIKKEKKKERKAQIKSGFNPVKSMFNFKRKNKKPDTE